MFWLPRSNRRRALAVSAAAGAAALAASASARGARVSGREGRLKRSGIEDRQDRTLPALPPSPSPPPRGTCLPACRCHCHWRGEGAQPDPPRASLTCCHRGRRVRRHQQGRPPPPSGPPAPRARGRRCQGGPLSAGERSPGNSARLPRKQAAQAFPRRPVIRRRPSWNSAWPGRRVDALLPARPASISPGPGGALGHGERGRFSPLHRPIQAAPLRPSGPCRLRPSTRVLGCPCLPRVPSSLGSNREGGAKLVEV